MLKSSTVQGAFWKDRRLAQLPAFTRLFYIATQAIADDNGVFPADPVFLKNELFAYDANVRVKDISLCIGRLVATLFIVPFEYNGERYLGNSCARVHQRTDRRYSFEYVPYDVVVAVLENAKRQTHDECTTGARRVHGGRTAGTRRVPGEDFGEETQQSVNESIEESTDIPGVAPASTRRAHGGHTAGEGLKRKENEENEEKESTKEKEVKEVKEKRESITRAYTRTLDERRESFGKSLQQYETQYGRAMLREFYEYWTEANKSHTKLRFELQPTWELAKRLSTWWRRSAAWQKEKSSAKKEKVYGNQGLSAESINDRLRRECLERVSAALAGGQAGEVGDDCERPPWAV